MAAYRVYTLKDTNYRAVPMGFSIGAFFASFLWAAANNLWGKAFILFIGFLSLAVTVGLGFYLNFEMLSFVALGGLVLLPIWAGSQGQNWVCASLEKKGYKLVRRINSTSASKAIASARSKNERRRKQEEAAANKQDNKPSFGRDFRDIRDNGAANSNQPDPDAFNQEPAWRRNRR